MQNLSLLPSLPTHISVQQQPLVFSVHWHICTYLLNWNHTVPIALQRVFAIHTEVNRAFPSFELPLPFTRFRKSTPSSNKIFLLGYYCAIWSALPGCAAAWLCTHSTHAVTHIYPELPRHQGPWASKWCTLYLQMRDGCESLDPELGRRQELV